MPDKKRSIGRYKIESKLGQGAAGTVYKAFDPVLQRTVALKIPKTPTASGISEIKEGQDFYNEAVMGGQFQHENIVSIYDVGRDNKIDYLVMEYVDGLSLKQHLKQNKPLSINYVTECIFRLCLALDYIHYHDIVHRDIKPDNIMVNIENDVIKLMDFSSASRTLNFSGDKTGSAPYMAPELHESGSMIALQSDIFSLGAVMYEMLTGVMAFPGDDAMTCVYKVVNEEPEDAQRLRQEIPDELVEIVQKALEKNPENRLQSILEFADAVQLYKQNNEGRNAKNILKQEQYLIFRRDAFFKNFSPDQVSELLDAGEVQLFSDKQVILEEGIENRTFFLVLEGEVRVLKGRQTIRKLGEGECFGEMSYLTEVKTTASIVARGNVMIWGVLPGLLEKLSCSSQLEFQNAFIEMIVQRLSRGTQDVARLQEMLYRVKHKNKN